MTTNGGAPKVPTPGEVAAEFFGAVGRGDGERVWGLFSQRARHFVVDRAVRRGLGPEVGRAILDESVDATTRRSYLEDLLAGLGRDLEGIRLDLIEIGDETSTDDGRIRVTVLERFLVEVGTPPPPLPVASVIVTAEGGEWKVDHLVVRPGP